MGDDDGGAERVTAFEEDELCCRELLTTPFRLYFGFLARNSSKLKSSAGCMIFEDAFDAGAEFVVGGALIVALLEGGLNGYNLISR